MKNDHFIVLVLRLLVTLVSLGIMIPYVNNPINMSFQITACVYGLGKLLDVAINVVHSGYKKYNTLCIIALVTCLLSITANFIVFAYSSSNTLSNNVSENYVEQKKEIDTTEKEARQSEISETEKKIDSVEAATTEIEQAETEQQKQSLDSKETIDWKNLIPIIVNFAVLLLLVVSSLPDVVIMGDYIARLRNTKRIGFSE